MEGEVREKKVDVKEESKLVFFEEREGIEWKIQRDEKWYGDRQTLVLLVISMSLFFGMAVTILVVYLLF